MEWVDNSDPCGTSFSRQLVPKTSPAPNENPEDYMKMYILINRSKLTIVQCGVQAAHSAAEFSYFYHDVPATKEWAEKHKTMIFLEATEDEITQTAEFFQRQGKKAYIFKEPDLGDLITACAFEPVLSTDGKVIFGKFKLLR